MAGTDRVAFLGLGIMGYPMAANVCRAGYELTVWNRTRERAEAFAVEHGGVAVADSPAVAAAQADVVITMVPDSPQVEEVLFAAAPGMSEGMLAIDMSTIAPTASRALAQKLRDRAGVSFLEAPVTGSRPKAEDGTLTIMAGGEASDFERARPLFESMGKLVLHVGPSGHGQMIKLINNTLAAVNAAVLAEGIVLSEAAGVDGEKMRQVIASGAAASTMVDLKARPMLDREFDPLFKLEHMLKDVRHCIAEAEAFGLDLPLAKLAESLYSRAAEKGLGARDFAAVIEVTEPKKP
jgi:3-hydroxyisobutyrate dehydrogenase-like beta-hydroxyacid dehydrogenase